MRYASAYIYTYIKMSANKVCLIMLHCLQILILSFLSLVPPSYAFLNASAVMHHCLLLLLLLTQPSSSTFPDQTGSPLRGRFPFCWNPFSRAILCVCPVLKLWIPACPSDASPSRVRLAVCRLSVPVVQSGSESHRVYPLLVFTLTPPWWIVRGSAVLPLP